jgi:hypothetical protein
LIERIFSPMLPCSRQTAGLVAWKAWKKGFYTKNIFSRVELTHKLRIELLAHGERIMTKLILIVALAIAASPAFAQSQEDQAACTPDVMRLCQQDIPDQSRIVACLVRSKLQLSPACSGVFNRARTASVPRTKL